MTSVSAMHLHTREPIIPSQIRRAFPALRRTMFPRLRASRSPTPAISSAATTRCTGWPRSTLPPGPVCATVTTVKVPPGDNLGVVKAVSIASPGDILVIDAQGFTTWCLGGFQILRAAIEDYGLAGFV